MSNSILNNIWENDIYLKQIDFNKYKLISIDIFDTLLLRVYEKPESLYEELCKICISEKLIDSFYNPELFRNTRLNAGKKAYKANRKAKIQDIYKCMPPSMNDSKIIEIELQLEKMGCYLNESVVSLIKHANNLGIKVILTSDMYLSKKCITEILEFNKFDITLIWNILVSCEVGLTKSNSLMYKHILKSFNSLASTEILHIGDNFYSDYINAKINGIDSIHYNVVPEKLFDKFHIEKIYNNEVLIPEFLSLRKLAASLNKYKLTEFEEWFDIGATIIGPFLYLVCEYILNFCNDKKVKKIYPIMREGALFADLLKLIIENRRYDIEMELVYASRISTFTLDPNDLVSDILNSLKYMKTLRILFTYLDLDLKDGIYDEIVDIFDISYIEIINRPIILKRLMRFFKKEEIINKISYSMEIKQKKLRDYLGRFDFKSSNYAFLDLGFSGTSIYAINKIIKTMENENIRGYNILAISKSKNILEMGNDISNLISFFEEESGYDYGMLQCLMMNDDGSTKDYIYTDDGIYPVLDNNYMSDMQKKGIGICQEGIKLFFELSLKMKSPTIDKINYERKSVSKIFNRIKKVPSYAEMKMLNNIIDEDCGRLFNITSFDYKNVIGKTYYNIDKLTDRMDDSTYKYYKLATSIKEKGLEEIVIFGLNESTDTVINALRVFGINVRLILTRKKEFFSMIVKGIPVQSLDDIEDFNSETPIIFIEDDYTGIEINFVIDLFTEKAKSYYIIKLDGSEFIG